jgi:DNA-binding transcriptional ArsR family regulator
VDVLQIVAEPRRREILRLVWRDELPVGTLVDRLDLSYAGVSQHLSVLREAGFVQVRRDGKRRLYRADLARLGALTPVLEAFWGERVDKLARLAEDAELR